MLNLYRLTITGFLLVNLFTTAQTQAEKSQETQYWFGVSLGLPTSLRVGIKDIFAEDIDLRVDGFLSLATNPDGGEEGAGIAGFATNVIYSPDAEGFQPYIGTGIEIDFAEEFCLFCSGENYSGTYLGVAGLAGFEVGAKHIKFFGEAGASLAALLAGEDNPPSTLLIPHITIGINFLF